MARHKIRINHLEHLLESGLDPIPRLILRSVLTVLINATMLLMVLATTKVFTLVVANTNAGDIALFGFMGNDYLAHTIRFTNITACILFTTSALTKLIQPSAQG